MSTGSTSKQATTVLTYGMVGGGEGAFIGDVHRKSAQFDGKARIAAGSFSRNYDNTLATGARLGIDQSRLYKTYQEMAEAEANREDGIDFVIVVTPNFLHYEVAKAFLLQGIHVVCDKPLTLEVEHAEDLQAIADAKDLLFCVTYTYTGYPLVKHAREMIRRGDIGEIRFVNAEYPGDWLANPVEQSGEHKGASWRTDPAQAGKSNCVGDIGTHTENMISYLTGLKIKSLCARLDTIVEGRVLDDNATVMVEYEGGAKGVYWMSQIAVGHDNALKARIYGSKGSITWAQEDPNSLTVAYLDKPTEVVVRGRDTLYPHAQQCSRIPSGHPEGYYEAFANIYAAFIDALSKKNAGGALTEEDLDFPMVQEGIDGVRFVGKCVESSQQGAVWVEY